MDSNTEEPSSPARDGLEQAGNHIPRDDVDLVEDPSPADAPAGESAGDAADEDLPAADSAGGITYVPDHEETDPAGRAPGLNKATGPAEEKDEQTADERDLTTDISPSD